MTFDEYNTDENFKDNKSSLEELVKLGINEGKSSDEIKSSLSPAWQNSKKIGEFDNYVSKYSKPKTEETAPKTFDINNTALGMSKNSVTPKPSAPVSNPKEKPTEEKIAEKVLEESTAPKTEKKNDLDKQTENYMKDNNAISYAQEDAENARQEESLEKRWNTRLANADKISNSMKRIDDHMIDQLPTFMFRRYQNGEFGDPKSTDAKLRLAHFMLNGVQTALRRFSNGAALAAGKSPMYANEMSDYEQYQMKNLTEGMENRWNKYKQETQSAIDIAKQGGMSEESLTDSIATISSNNRLQSAFNQMNEREKVFALQVLGEIGGKMGNMNDTQFVNTLMGMSAMGDSLDYKEAAAMLVYRTVKDPEKRNAILSSLGFDGVGGGLLGGIGGALGSKKDKDEETETGATLEDGTRVDPGKRMNDKEYEELRLAGDKLSTQYYNGEIDEAKFRSEYAKLEKIMSEHGWYSFFKNKGIKSADDLIRINNNENLLKLDEELETLNSQARNGNIKPSDYAKKFNSIVERASKWGATEKYLNAINKGRVKDEAIIKASEKNAKKASKKK